MSTQVEKNYEESENAIDREMDIFRILWYTGITISLLTIIIKIILFVLLKSCRKFDEIILFQMACARILNSVLENVIVYNMLGVTDLVKYVIYIGYYHTDFVLLAWMCLFTKNLYEKIVVVFDIKKHRLLLYSTFFWIFPLLLSAPVPFFLKMANKSFFYYYTTITYHLKFIVLLLNVFAFIKILSVAFFQGHRHRSRRECVKCAIVGFTLVLITSIQVLITDLIAYSYGIIQCDILVLSFCVINSFQVLPFFAIFLLLIRGKVSKSNSRSVKLSNISSK